MLLIDEEANYGNGKDFPFEFASRIKNSVTPAHFAHEEFLAKFQRVFATIAVFVQEIVGKKILTHAFPWTTVQP